MLSIALIALAITGPADQPVVVDPEGVLRWESSGAEVALFGVNYYAPFYAEFREMTEKGVSVREAIDRDVEQFARLRFDLLRLHCFDREFSAADGGIVQNEHLAALDHLIAEAKRRGIYTLLTPIAWWPTPGDIGGFSHGIPMQDMTTKPEAWEIERRYLREFVTHVNPETGLSYGDDPGVVGFELINEPIYADATTDETVTRYIDGLTDAIRATGCRKPIFYNAWGGRYKALLASKATGCSFGWYPTGLASGGAVETDCLSLVDSFPPALDPVLAHTPTAVYEFDCADTPNGVLYPAMARSFRAAGIQLAAQFQYDATATAWHNAHWQTHYMNLVYAPQKALAMMVASEAFHRLPRGGTYRPHPEGDRFAPFRVGHSEGVSEMADEEAFLYSATTATAPPAPERLVRIAGRGSSPIVSYEGTGAYFLDKQTDGTWRLEVYPDSVWVADPFASSQPGRDASRVYSRSRAMTITLPDLGPEFGFESLEGANARNPVRGTAAAGRFLVSPGVWTLAPHGVAMPPDQLGERFYAPPDSPFGPTAFVALPAMVAEGVEVPLRLTIAGPEDAEAPTLQLTDGGAPIPLARITPYDFRGTAPADRVKPPELGLRVDARLGAAMLRFPSGAPADLAASSLSRSLIDFASLTAAPALDQPANTIGGKCALVPAEGGARPVRLSADRFTAAESWLGFRLQVEPVPGDARSLTALVIRGRRVLPQTRGFEIGLVMDDGTGYGTVVVLPPAWGEVRVPLDSLRLLWQRPGRPFSLEHLEAITIGMGPYTLGPTGEVAHALELGSISLGPREDEWRVPCLARGAPLPLVHDGAIPPFRIGGDAPLRTLECVGPEPGSLGTRLEADRFEGSQCAGVEISVGKTVAGVRSAIASYGTLVLRMRAGEARTNRCEVVLKEEDGTPFGTVVELTPEWQELRLPTADLRHFAHWQSSPPGRGGEGDHLHPDRLRSIHLTFGAWLFPDTKLERHAVEVGYIGFER